MALYHACGIGERKRVEKKIIREQMEARCLRTTCEAFNPSVTLFLMCSSLYGIFRRGLPYLLSLLLNEDSNITDVSATSAKIYLCYLEIPINSPAQHITVLIHLWSRLLTESTLHTKRYLYFFASTVSYVFCRVGNISNVAMN